MNDPRRPSPIFLLAGGGRSRRKGGDALLSQVLASTGLSRPSVAYIGAASDDDRSFFSMIARALQASGSGEVTLAPLVDAGARIAQAKAIVEAADLVFVSGGDVEVGMDVLHDRGIVPFLRDLHSQGKPFFGLSAGSIMLCTQWILWEDPDDDRTARAFDCLGLAPVICDTHGEAEGWEELQALLALCPDGTTGHGIPSGAALAVHPDGRLEALGGAVHRYAHRSGKVVRIEDLSV